MLPTTFVTTTTGRRVRLARLGTGPPLVLLHGYPDNLQIWCKAAPQLAEHFEVLAVDWPGLGYSDAWPGGATPMHLADRLRQLLDAWRIECASVVGLDMGGQPALAFAGSGRYSRPRPGPRRPTLPVPPSPKPVPRPT